MNTVQELIRAGTESLIDSSESARLDALVLLSMATGYSRTKLLAESKITFEADICARFFDLLSERKRGTPVAYLVGEREFYSLPFQVSPEVLIPRPETEQLVDLARTHLASKNKPTVLDLGTGSGCIAIALALEMKKLRLYSSITAVDISSGALEIARSNALRLDVDNIHFLQSSWFANVTGAFDLIVSNPPYIPINDRNVSSDTRFEPSVALYSGVDGCDAFREILNTARSYLKPDGLFIGEHGVLQGARIRELAIKSGFRPDLVHTHQDLTGRDRFIACKV